MQKMMVMLKNSGIQVINVVVVLFSILFFALETEANPKRPNLNDDLTQIYYNKHNISVSLAIPSNEEKNNKQKPIEITCPEDISTYTDLSSCSSYISGGLNVQYPENTITRLSWEMTGATIESSEKTGINQINEYTFNEGVTTVTYTAEDQYANVTTCSFTVTIWDNQVPRLENMPGNITVSATPGECSATVFWREPTASDNCSSASEIIKEASISPGSIFPVGKTIVYYHAYDAMGNHSTPQSFTITVQDTESPQILLPEEITINCEDETPAPWQTFQQLTAAGGYAIDNCEIDETSFHLLSETSDAESCPLTISRIYEISDVQGNTSTAKFLIHVTASKDNIKQVTPVLKSGAAVITALGGNWNDVSTWQGGVIPGAGDDVIIPPGVTVTVDAASECNDIAIDGTLNHSGATTLDVNGDWTNNGTYNAGSGTVAFVGTTDATLNGSSASDFENLIINKGTSLSPILDVTASISVSDPTFLNGTLKLNSGTTNIVHGFNIPSTSGLWLNGATLSTGDFSIDNNGLIRISSGTANIGNSSGNSVHTQIDGAFEVTGGTVNIAGRLENTASGTLATGIPSGIHISGGTITLATVGNVLSNVGSLNVTSNGTFDFTGGTIVFQNPSSGTTELDLGLISGTGTKNTVGGTFQFGNTSTPPGADFNISSDILLDNITSTANANLSLNNDLLVNQLNLGSNGIDLNGNALQLSATSTGIYNFPVNDGNGNLIPVIVDLTAGSITGGAFIEITTSGSKLSDNASAINYLNRYWTVTTSGITSPAYNITTAYTNGDVAGSDSEIAMGSWSGSLPWIKFANANTAANTLSATGINSTDITFSGITSDPPTIVINGGNATETICSGSSINLTTSVTGDPNFTYSWTSNPAGTAETTSSITVTPASTTIYTVTVTDGNGFTANDDIQVIAALPIAASATIADPITCFGGTANIQISASGGIAPYTYNFEGESPNSTGIFTGITGSVAGIDYDWSVTDANGCAPFNGTITVTQPVELNANAAITSPISCSGGTATITITATGGTNPLSYTFNGITNTTGVFPNIVAGNNISWSVTDANNCGPVAGTIDVSEPNLISIVSADVSSPVTCNGGTATVTILAQGGTGTLSYTFNGQTNTTGVFTNVYAGTSLSYSVTDDNNCGPVFGSLDIPEPNAISANAVVSSPILCNGETATVTINASGGTGSLSYTFDGTTNATGVFTGINPGSNLPWSVTDANNCGPVSGTLNVTQPNDLTASVSETVSISCFGGTANILITASGGTGAKQYTFNGTTNATGSFTGITAQNGIAWDVTDANGCSVSGTYDVVQPTEIVINSIGSNSAICQGDNLNLTSSASGGTGTLSFNWTGPNGFTANNAQNPTILNATPAASGTYTLTVTDANNCTKTATTDVVVNPTATMTDPTDQVVCDNSSTAAVSFSGADSYSWINDNTSIGLAGSGSGNIPSFTATNTTDAPVTATITVTPTSNACPGTPQTFTITVNPIPEVEVTNNTPILCDDGVTSIVLFSDVAGTSFSWTATRISGSTTGYSSGNGNSIEQTLTGAGIVEYEITPSANGCTGSSATVSLEVISSNFDLEVFPSGSNPATVCPGYVFNLDFTGNNGSGTSGSWWSQTQWEWETRFTWTNTNTAIGLGSSGGPLTDPGNITFTTDNNTDIDQTAIISIIPWSYYRSRTYSWWGGWSSWSAWQQLCSGNAYSTTIIVNPFLAECPTDYNVNVDPGTCATSIATDAPTFDCPPNKLTWTMTGATSATSPGTGINYVAAQFFNVGTTTVTYDAEDGLGNTSNCSFTVTVTDDEAPVISNCPGDFNVPMDAGQCGAVINFTLPTANDNCDGVVSLVRTDGTGLNSGDVFPTGTTTIGYSATDAAGNTSICSFNVTVAADSEAPTLSCVPDQDVCANAGAPYTILGTTWNVTATDNCSGTITQIFALSGATTGTGTSLDNTEFNVGTTTVTWTATDANSNSATCSFDVNVNQSPAVTTDPISQSVCLNSPVNFSVVATGTPAPTYKWLKDGVEIPGATASILNIGAVQGSDAGSYTVEVENSCGTAISSPAVLTVSSAPIITTQPANQTDCFGESVLFTVAVSQGVPPYIYEWEKRNTPTDAWSSIVNNNSQLTISNIGDASNPNQTQYRVRIEDSCGNKDTSTVATLTVNNMELIPLVTESVCQGGSATFTVSTSGSNPIGYEWLLNGTPISNSGPYSGATSQTLTISNAQVTENGTYSARAIFNITQPNNNGAGVTTCEAGFIDVGALTVDEGPDIVATPQTQTICPGSAIAEIVLSNANGTPGTTYSWTRDNTTVLTGIPASGTGETINGVLTSLDPGSLQTTTFTITAIANGCVSTEQVTVTVGDDEVPTIANCPGDILQNTDAGICSATVNYTIPEFDDNCDGTGLTGTLTAGLATGSSFPIGTTTVTYEYTDAAGNGPVNCTFDVVVSENEDPIAVCQDITVQLDATGNASITAADIDNGSSDNCGIPVITLDINSFNCTDLGANTVTLTATDAIGNTNTCTSIVTVADDNFPVAISANVTQTAINCFGETSTVTIASTGGVGTLTYNFDGVSNGTGIFSNVSAGTYNWSVTNPLGCGNISGTFDVIQPDILSANIATTDVTCSPGSDGSITISDALGGSGNYEYSIDGGSTWQNSNLFTGLMQGTYDVQMRDADVSFPPGCVMPLDLVNVYTLTATVTSTNITCNGLSDGTISISNPHGGSGIFQYSLNGGAWQSSGNYSGLLPGTYEVRIRDFNEQTCISIIEPALPITEPDVLSADLVSTNITCNGASDGTITVSNPIGGYGTYEVSINGTTWYEVTTGTPYTFDNLSPGNHTVHIRDALHVTCTQNLTVQNLTEPDVLFANVSSTNVSCNGLNDGSITISGASGGSGIYEYSADGGTTWQSGSNFPNLYSGTYNVQIRDANEHSCVIVLNPALLITEPPALTIVTQPTDITDCFGSNVAFSTTTNGGAGTINYTWQRMKPLESNFTDIPGAETNVTYPVPGQMQLVNIGNSDAPDGTQYRVIVSDNCSSMISDTVTLTVNKIIAVSPATQNAEICEGEDYSYEVTTSGETPTAYQWQKFDAGVWNDVANNGIISGVTTSELTFTSATPAESGQYRVMVTFPASGSVNCNITSETFVRNLLVEQKSIVGTLPDSISYCQGEITPVIPLTGSLPGVVFDITGGSSIGLFNQTGVTEIPSFLAVPGTATIIITPQANGCAGIPDTIYIDVYTMPNISVSPMFQTICSGDATHISISSSTAGASFSWTTTVSPAGSVTGTSNATDTIVGNIAETLVNLTSTQATVVYTVWPENKGCYGHSVNITVRVQPNITIVVTDPADVCAPGTVDITDAAITAGSTSGLNLTYWEDSAALTPFTTPTTATSGTYYIKGTDPVTGCYEISPVNVTVVPKPTVVVNIPAPICSPGTVDLTDPAITSGSTAGLTFTYWEDAAATIPYADYTAAEDGVYYIKGETAEGCYDIQPVTVTIYTDVQTPVFDDGSTSSVCKNDGPRTYTATAVNATGLTYSIDAASQAAGNSINPSTGEVTFAPDFTGTITVAVTATGCTAPTTAIHTITVNELPTVSLAPLTSNICEGTGVTLTATSSGTTTPQTFTGSSSTNYNITNYNTINSPIVLSDPSGLTISATDLIVVTVNINHDYDDDVDMYLISPSGNQITLSTDNGGSNNDFPGTVFKNDASLPVISDGQYPFNKEFQPEESFSNLVGDLINGEWNLQIYDDRNSTGADEGTLLSWDIEIVSQTTNSYTTIFNGTSTSGDYYVNIGTATEVVYPPAGTYTYTATTIDENGCSATSNEVTINVDDSPDAFIAANYCAIDGKIVLTALGGAPGATYLWSTGETTNEIIIDEVNIYSVIITNPNGCSTYTDLDVSNELVVNGDFSAGNTGFTSGYGFRDPWVTPPSLATSSSNSALWDENYYGIGTNGRYYHTNFWGHQDHTSGDGNFMIVNGNTNAGTTIWEEIVNVEPNTDYYFSAWSMSLNSVGNDAVLQFEVNGVLVGSQARLPAGVSNDSNNGWIRFYSEPRWNSGSVSGPITIRIKNVEPAANGNDYAIDDISFGTLDPLPLQIDVYADTEICEGDTLFLFSNAEHGLQPITYFWTGPNGFTSDVPNPVIPNITLADAGQYKLEATDGYGCEVLPDSIVINVNIAPTVDAGPDQFACTGNPVVYLAGTIGGSASTATWSGSGGTFSDNTMLDATYTLSAAEVIAGGARLILTTDDPAGSCGMVRDTMDVTIFNSLEITSITPVDPFCYGMPTGKATVNVTNGAIPYEYLWSDGQTTPTAIDLADGTYWVTVTDANGCTATDTVTLTEPDPFIISARSPIITPPSCYGSSDGMAVVEVSGGTEPYTFQWDAAAGNQTRDTAFNLPAGNYFVYVTDSAGCTGTVISVTIPQPPPPTISCPPDVEDTIAADNCTIIYADLEEPSLSGYCATTLTYTLSGATTGSGTGSVNGVPLNVGQTFVKYVIEDSAGNKDSCSFMVWSKHLDIPATSYTCPAPLVSQDVDAGSCDAYIALDTVQIVDPCNDIDSVWNNSPYAISPADASGTYPVGSTLFNWYIADVSGNIDSCQVEVVVNDTIPPFVTCPPDAVETAAPGNCSQTMAAITDPTYGDLCSTATLTWTMSGATTGAGTGTVTGETFNVGATTVQYFVEDAAGNRDSCSFEVSIIHVDIPTSSFNCPTNTVTVSAIAGGCEAPVTLDAPVITDPCNEIDSVWNNSPYRTSYSDASGNYPVGTTNFNWYITDVSGNIDSCQVEVVVNDTIPPFVTCPPDVEETAAPGNCSQTLAAVTDPTYGDLCSTATLTWTMSGATTGTGTGTVTGETFNIGVTTVQYFVEDASGNRDSCSFEVSIIHVDIPTTAFTCPTNTVTVSAIAGSCEAPVTLDAPLITDPCNEIDSVWNNSPYRTSYSDASGNYPVGTTNFNWYITDVSGNIDSCQVEVVVNDTIPPFVTCPPDVEETAAPGNCSQTLAAVTDPTYGDLCSTATLTWTMSGATTGTGTGTVTGETFNIGVTTVQYFVEDASGNRDSCSFEVSIIHVDIPTTAFTCPTNTVTVSAIAGSCEAPVTLDAPLITDPCNEIDSVWNNSPYQTSYSDASGNYPVGTTNFNWYITDISGNVDSCEVEVIVTDLPATLDCPSDFSVPADFGFPYATNVTIPPPVHDDNCDYILFWGMHGATTDTSLVFNTIDIVPSPYSQLNEGDNIITYYLVDSNNDTLSCSFTITVEGSPELNCSIDTSVYADSGCINTFDPGIPDLIAGVAPIDWTWEMTGATTGSGSTDDANPLPNNIGPWTFNQGITTITWIAKNISGTDTCRQIIEVLDTIPPTFNSAPIENCVDMLTSVVYSESNPNPNSGTNPNLIKNPSPDYYTFKAGDTSLDITGLSDNCCAPADMTIHWQIDFADTPDPLNPTGPALTHASISGTGQPSNYGSDMYFPGDGVNFSDASHTITYWVEDCNGNISENQVEEIKITPRPQIIKLN